MSELKTIDAGSRLARIVKRFNLSEFRGDEDDADIGWLIGEIRRLRADQKRLCDVIRPFTIPVKVGGGLYIPAQAAVLREIESE